MSAPRRVLVVKLADFGDALLTTPAIRALRRAYPDSTIDVLTTPQSAVVFRHSGLVDAVIPFRKETFDRAADAITDPMAPLSLARRLRAHRYDAVALMHSLVTRRGAVKHAALTLATGAPLRAGLARPGSPRGRFLNRPAADLGYDRSHVVSSCLAVAGALGAPPDGDQRLTFVPGAEADSAARALLANAGPGNGPLVAIHPGSGPYSPARRWPAARFAATADALALAGCRVVLVGTASDGADRVRSAARCTVCDLTGRTDLPTLGALLREVDLYVGNDSGVMHLAAAMLTPVVAIFGPSNANAWAPWWPSGDLPGEGSSPHRIVAMDLPCQPCLYSGHELGSPAGCPTRDCLEWLGPERVVSAALEALSRGPSPSSTAGVPGRLGAGAAGGYGAGTAGG